jgi:methylthioribose-1-phosphate isomerase
VFPKQNSVGPDGWGNQVILPLAGKSALLRMEECSGLLEEARRIHDEDRDMCARIGAHGAALLPDGAGVLTHCNAGALATAGYGTALGVIRAAHAQKKIKKVLVDETRPYLQGARLTAWELVQERIPHELITDNMAAHFLRKENVKAIIVGCDRVAANGDTANKIGTYGLAVLAKYHKVPFYVAMPTSTLDLKIKHGRDIPIEDRSSDEVTNVGKIRIAPKKTTARHPAFDVTPNGLITAFVTEKGIVRAPYQKNLKKLVRVSS